MRLEVADIQRIIPHRFPFLMIDRILECQPNAKLVAVKNVSINEHYFSGMAEAEIGFGIKEV